MHNTFLAHIRCGDTGTYNQSLLEHNRNTAVYASAALNSVGLANAAYLAGLLHDAGKSTAAYQAYLHKAVFGENVVRGSVNHTFAAVRILLTRYHRNPQSYAPLTSELLAYAVGAHHGLFDCIDSQSKSGFQHRLDKDDPDCAEGASNYLAQCVTQEELDQLFDLSVTETEAFVSRMFLEDSEVPREDEAQFQLGLLARLLCSAVIEGDRRDTAEFMNAAHFPLLPEGAEKIALWQALSSQVDYRLDALPANTPIEKARQTISRKCRNMAMQQSTVYRLNVPTGAGKTLSSLRFALSHAAQWGKSRIIFTSPLLSILDQTAEVIRDYIQNDSLILEHHSNVIHPTEQGEDLDQLELMMATWDSPIIITTLVQLLNTLFDGSGSCIRRFHSLCDSIIIIDEVQTVPNHLLSLFNQAVSFLANACKATVVLCSATQPCSEKSDHPITAQIKDMVPYDAALWNVFQRTHLENANSLNLEEIPAFATEVLTAADSLLIVCNKKSEAEFLYRALPDCYEKFYLSASLCKAHRRKALAELQQALHHETQKKIVCISTQVIEAGVDISFARVMRLTAGLDSMVQAAGRCNRNGESATPVPVYLVNCADENLSHLPDIKRGKDASLALLAEYRQNPKIFSNDLTSDASIRYYYTRLYQKEMPKGLQDAPVDPNGIKTSLFSLLSDNRDFADFDKNQSLGDFCLPQAFQTAGKNFTVYGNNTTDILVPYGEGQTLIAALTALHLPADYAKLKDLMEQTKPYTVSVYAWQKEKLLAEHALIPLFDGEILMLQDGYYDEVLGLTAERGTMKFQEV